MCKLELASDTELDLGYLDDEADVSWFFLVVWGLNVEKNAVLANCHGSCNFGFKIIRLATDTEPDLHY